MPAGPCLLPYQSEESWIRLMDKVLDRGAHDDVLRRHVEQDEAEDGECGLHGESREPDAVGPEKRMRKMRTSALTFAVFRGRLTTWASAAPPQGASTGHKVDDLDPARWALQPRPIKLRSQPTRAPSRGAESRRLQQRLEPSRLENASSGREGANMESPYREDHNGCPLSNDERAGPRPPFRKVKSGRSAKR